MSDFCKTCGKPLTNDDIGFYKKMVNRGAEEFSCIACLSRHFDLREDQSRALIERWRAAGCALFCSEGERE